MNTPLPPVFAVQCSGDGDHWFAISPIRRPHDGITLDRRRLGADDCRGLATFESSIQIVRGDAVGGLKGQVR
jgi:hypothetical protein